MEIHFVSNTRRLCDGLEAHRKGVKYRLYRNFPDHYQPEVDKGRFVYASAEDLTTCKGCLRARRAFHQASINRLTIRIGDQGPVGES